MGLKLLTELIILIGLLGVIIYFIVKKLFNLIMLVYLRSLIGLIYINFILNIVINLLGVNLYNIDKT